MWSVNDLLSCSSIPELEIGSSARITKFRMLNLRQKSGWGIPGGGKPQSPTHVQFFGIGVGGDVLLDGRLLPQALPRLQPWVKKFQLILQWRPHVFLIKTGSGENRPVAERRKWVDPPSHATWDLIFSLMIFNGEDMLPFLPRYTY